ncbi:Uncharacterised protein [Serratia fonticola]|uniref:Uncharacterized protein n=1 Tax=Serratia fonticola TaxID=47917 RepID=A0A4U9W2M9_SERFO|nr:Uncharacterised protein [Serratia fonticola]
MPVRQAMPIRRLIALLRHCSRLKSSKKIRLQGYAVRYNVTEGIPGARAIACPIFSQDNVLLGMAITMGFIPDDPAEIVRLAGSPDGEGQNDPALTGTKVTTRGL